MAKKQTTKKKQTAKKQTTKKKQTVKKMTKAVPAAARILIDDVIGELIKILTNPDSV